MLQIDSFFDKKKHFHTQAAGREGKREREGETHINTNGHIQRERLKLTYLQIKNLRDTHTYPAINKEKKRQ